MKKKVVHLVGHFPSKSETFIVNQITASIDEGYEAVVLADRIVEQSQSSQPELLDKYNLYKTAKCATPKMPKSKIVKLFTAILLLLKNIKHFNVFFKSLNTNKFKGKASSLKLWYQAAIFLEYYDVAIFHAHFGVNGTVLADLKEIGAIKGHIVVSFYGYDTFSTSDNREEQKKYYDRLFQQATLIYANSNYLINNLRKLNVPEKKTLVNYVGVDQRFFKFKERDKNKVFTIITIGRLIKLKGHIYGLQTVKKLKDLGYTIHYNLVGDGEEMENLQQEANKLGIQNQVSFFGSQTQTEILNLLYCSNLFLMLSITDETGRAEGQGLVTAEAQATGLPAFGFLSGGVPETISNEKTGYVFEEKDVDSLVAKIIFLIDNPKVCMQFGENAVDFVSENFNNNKQALKIVNQYNKLLQ